MELVKIRSESVENAVKSESFYCLDIAHHQHLEQVSIAFVYKSINKLPLQKALNRKADC